MKKNEKKLFISLCDFQKQDKNNIEKLIKEGAATAAVLGCLFENRMAGAAYKVLKDCGLLGSVNREFRNSLKSAFIYNEKYNSDFFGCVRHLAEQLNPCNIKYALLKGAYLCGWYPQGLRTSNDIDVLINYRDIGRVDAKLKAAGFKQGYIRGDMFEPATREQIISSKMLRGETVPYIKEIKLPYIKYLEVDINFSLDYKNTETDILDRMLERTAEAKTGNTVYKTLDKYDFFLHLCCHLFKEATTLPWIEMRRDMTVYKYLDIKALFSEMTEDEKRELSERARENKMTDELGYAVSSAAALFGMQADIPDFDREILNCAVSPAGNKKYRYTEADILKRFFAGDRKKLLEEITDGKA